MDTKPNLLERLTAASRESAAVELFLHLCRGSPELRRWLWADFAHDPEVRRRTADLVARPDRAIERFANLGEDNPPWSVEARALRARFARTVHGGLPRREIEALLLRYQAGQIALPAFLLALEWSDRDPRSLHAAWHLVDAVMRGEIALLRDLGRAAEMARSKTNTSTRSLVGYADWWKLHALLYILRHPAPAYRTRELRAHLLGMGLNVSSKDLRRFCTRHGIRRDTRAGRPAMHRGTRQPTETKSRTRRRPALTATSVHRLR